MTEARGRVLQSPQLGIGSITDVPGVLLGHHQRTGRGWRSGTTVVLTPDGATAGIDVRGGGPGTRETDLLDPSNSVRHVDAVVLTGGSAYGLAAADGVMNWLEPHGRGVALDGGVVPIVPAAVIFDLPVGGWQCRPDAQFGYRAAEAAGIEVGIGTVGAGVGARAGVLKGGVGTASVTLASGVTVGALVVVNSAGDVVDPDTGRELPERREGRLQFRERDGDVDRGRVGLGTRSGQRRHEDPVRGDGISDLNGFEQC